MLGLALTILLQSTPGAAPSPAPAQIPAPAPPADRVRVLLPADKRALLGTGETRGRMLLFLIQEGSKAGPHPVDAPFFDDPQPMYSVGVTKLVPGQPVELDADAISFPVPITELEGRFRVQAVFDRDRTERGHAATGNLYSAEETIDFSRTRADTPTVELSKAFVPDSLPTAPNLRFFEMKSPLLSRAAGRDVIMRAGIALPTGWADPNHRRRMWPAFYVIPGFGGGRQAAAEYARMLATPGSGNIVPQAVWIVLDPDAPLGHHGFVDSAANGPRAEALVTEFIPELERQFHLIRRAEARVVTGHSSGGWSSLWLQLTHPETFGACFSSAPDPVDFSAFQLSDLYADASVFTDAEGKEQCSYRTPIMKQFDKVRMTVRQEAAMERVLGPDRDSGEQWDAWSAMWSAVDPRTRLPRPMFDGATGSIDRGVVGNEWSRFDITRLLRNDPDRYAPLLRQRVRLLCGGRDNFYLNRAVERLRDQMAALETQRAAAGKPLPAGPGYIEIMPNETHGTLPASSMLRWQREMRDYLTANKLD